MIRDEEQHGEAAMAAGGAALPAPAKWAMSALSQVMKKTTYRL
jgi:ubiquinone biosynthesis monooxygenase Coq7